QIDARVGEVRFSWDGLGRPTGQNSSRSDVQPAAWTYDANGNPSHVLGGRPLVYDRHDRLRDDGERTYEYDALGRLTARVDGDGSRTQFAYDLNDQLTEVRQADGTTTRYEYDAFGRRVCKEHAGTRTRYMWDGHFLLAEWQESDPPQFTQYVFDQTTMTPLLELKSDGSGNYQAYHCHCDPVGALTEMTGNAGQVVWAAEYDVLGGIMMRTGEAAFTSLRFPGQYHDEE